jgi:tetratricopeptide (TPR) repeat protein
MLPHPSRRVFPFLLSILVSTALFAADPPREKEQWTGVRTDGFEIYSNAGEKTVTQVARDLEAMRSAVARMTTMRTRTPLTTKIYIFRNHVSFAPYAEAGFGRTSVTGGFFAHPNGNYIILNSEARTDGVVYHELMHYFINNMNPDLPLWLNEGLAEFYSSFETAGEYVHIGKLIDPHVSLLRDRPLIPLRDLFAMTSDSRDYNEGLRQGIFYAQSWAFVHYLLLGNPDRAGQLGAFEKQLALNKSPEAAATAAFGTTLEKMEEELRAYVRQSRFNYTRYSLGDMATSSSADPAALRYDEVLYQLGDLLTHLSDRDYTDAETFLKKALELRPGHAGANASLGFIHEVEGRPKEAAAHYQRAVAGAGSDYLPFLLAGENIIRQLADLPAETAATEEERARALFRQAIERRKDHPRAWAGLGKTYLAADDPTDGIAALHKSWELAPSQPDVAYGLVILYARTGNSEKAHDIFERILVKIGDEAAVASARELLLYSDAERAAELLDQGKPAEGEALMRKVLAETRDPGLRKLLEDQLGRIKASAAHSRSVEMYNKAVGLANGGNYSAAMKTIEELIASDPAIEILNPAREMRERLRTFLK